MADSTRKWTELFMDIKAMGIHDFSHYITTSFFEEKHGIGVFDLLTNANDNIEFKNSTLSLMGLIVSAIERKEISTIGEFNRFDDFIVDRNLFYEKYIPLDNDDTCHEKKVIDDISFIYDRITSKTYADINPKEVIQWLYLRAYERDLYLPQSLISFCERKDKLSPFLAELQSKQKNKSQKEKPLNEQKTGNRSGSNINPQKHAATEKACEQVLDKIRNEKILELNQEKFDDLVKDVMNRGESPITTVTRAFYRKKLDSLYKKGKGRPSK